jgi:hypothetical protein
MDLEGSRLLLTHGTRTLHREALGEGERIVNFAGPC